MSICITRYNTIKVNCGGVAHETGYIAEGANSMRNEEPGHVKIYVGTARQRSKWIKFTTHGKPVWSGKRSELTKDAFLKATGWKPS